MKKVSLDDVMDVYMKEKENLNFNLERREIRRAMFSALLDEKVKTSKLRREGKRITWIMPFFSVSGTRLAISKHHLDMYTKNRPSRWLEKYTLHYGVLSFDWPVGLDEIMYPKFVSPPCLTVSFNFYAGFIFLLHFGDLLRFCIVYR